MTDTPDISIRIVDPEQPSDQTTVDAASVEQFHQVKDEKAKKDYEDRAFLAYLFSLEVGRRFLWKHLAHFHPFETIHATSPAGLPDERATWYQHGLQQQGMALYQTWLVAHPTEVAAMHRECDARLQPAPEKKKRQRTKTSG